MRNDSHVPTRRQALALLGAAPFAGVLTTQAQAQAAVSEAALIEAAKKEGRVVVYSIFAQTVEAKLMKRFQDKYGIVVEYNRLGGTGPTLQKFYSEARVRQNVTDVLMLEKSGNAILVKDNMAAAFTPASDASIVKEFRSADGKVHNILLSFQSIVYNKNLMKTEDLPAKWADLALPKYKGKLVVGSPENSGTALAMVKGWTDLYGWDFVRALAANDVLQVTREVEGADLVGRGERSIAALSQVSPAAQIAGGAPLGFHLTENPIACEFAASISARAPHPNAARLFVNYWQSEANQESLVKEIGGFSVLPTVAPPPGFPPLTSITARRINYADLLNERDNLIAEWRKIMG
jgi:iron(III) transport system substrate-binding protein